jgi:hypothetical protein
MSVDGNLVTKQNGSAPARLHTGLHKGFSLSSHFKTMASLVLLFFAVPFLTGCQTNPKPHMRTGAFFGSPTGIYFPEPDRLGKHKYKKSLTETNGLVYTCKGGFIDVGHMREAADRTAYLARLTFKNIMQGQKSFSFRVIEPSKYLVTIKYPEDWNDLPKKQKAVVATDVSIKLGQYFAQTSTIWHEILTWFGFTSMAVFSEHISSFSWEDNYSDLLGTCLAEQAMRYTEYKFEDAMTMLIAEEMERLNIQPAIITQMAVEKVKGKWYTGGMYFFVSMNKRNFDTGWDDGFITPWLVPDICPDTEPVLCPSPNLDFLCGYGFSVELEIEPVELEKSKILHIIYPNHEKKRVRPADHFGVIIEYIIKQAKERYGPQVDVPNL